MGGTKIRILVHIPSRSRPIQLAHALAEWERMSSGNRQTGFLVSLDKDDATCHYFKSPTKLPTAIAYGISDSKIAAINRDVGGVDWDVLISASDDLLPATHMWDDIIRREFENHFDSTDGALWIQDGFNTKINCHPVIGRKCYDRYGYIYHPSYHSLYCDNEYTWSLDKLGLLKKTDKVSFRHLHYRARNRKPDALDKKNEAFMKQDTTFMASGVPQDFQDEYLQINHQERRQTGDADSSGDCGVLCRYLGV